MLGFSRRSMLAIAALALCAFACASTDSYAPIAQQLVGKWALDYTTDANGVEMSRAQTADPNRFRILANGNWIFEGSVLGRRTQSVARWRIENVDGNEVTVELRSNDEVHHLTLELVERDVFRRKSPRGWAYYKRVTAATN